MKESILEKIHGGLIVSCQALENEPLYGNGIMAKMALAAQQGGACGIRANTGRDIRQIKEQVTLPVIGIVKRVYEDSEVYITPTMTEVKEVAESGAEIVAIDCTARRRPGGILLENLIKEIRQTYPELLIMADISTAQEGIQAEKLGVDLVGTTLSGYTDYSRHQENPDYELMEELVKNVSVPVIAEGKIARPEDMCRAFDKGAFAVVVGGAVTRPKQITERFVAMLR